MSTIEKVLQRRYQVTRQDVRRIVSEARENLGIPEACMWSDGLEKESVRLLEVHGFIKNGKNNCTPATQRAEFRLLAPSRPYSSSGSSSSSDGSKSNDNNNKEQRQTKRPPRRKPSFSTPVRARLAEPNSNHAQSISSQTLPPLTAAVASCQSLNGGSDDASLSLSMVMSVDLKAKRSNAAQSRDYQQQTNSAIPPSCLRRPGESGSSSRRRMTSSNPKILPPHVVPKSSRAVDPMTAFMSDLLGSKITSNGIEEDESDDHEREDEDETDEDSSNHSTPRIILEQQGSPPKKLEAAASITTSGITTTKVVYNEKRKQRRPRGNLLQVVSDNAGSVRSLGSSVDARRRNRSTTCSVSTATTQSFGSSQSSYGNSTLSSNSTSSFASLDNSSTTGSSTLSASRFEVGLKNTLAPKIPRRSRSPH